MSLAGWSYQLMPADIDETPLPDESPQAYVIRLAEEKAQAAAADAPAGAIVIGADTTVYFEPENSRAEILGKPSDEAEAWRMLQMLRSRNHQVATGVAIIDKRDTINPAHLTSQIAITDVHMRNYSDAEIAAYVASRDPMDKAGAYAIQHSEFDPVDQFEGCYTNVMGLPVCLVNRILARMGLYPQIQDLTTNPQERYQECPLCAQVMKS